MLSLAERAIKTSDPIAMIVANFYGSAGPLRASGYEVRPQQMEMSLRFATMLDARGSQIGVIEAPCGTGKGLAYLLPGILMALRAEARWYARPVWNGEGQKPDNARPEVPNRKDHPLKLIVSTANIALQAQLVRKDIPALAAMLGVSVQATLLKSRANYVCRSKLDEIEDPDDGVDQIRSWAETSDGDREAVTWDVRAVWPLVSAQAEECAGEGCPHYKGSPRCFWRRAMETWPSSHVLVLNHHMAALSRGVHAFAWAVDEAHELEGALRGVQERTLTPSKMMGVAVAAAPFLLHEPEPGVMPPTPEEARAAQRRAFRPVTETVAWLINAHLEDTLRTQDHADPKRYEPLPLVAGWLENREARLRSVFKSWLGLRDHMCTEAFKLDCIFVGDRMTALPARGTSDAEQKAARERKTLASLCNRAIDIARQLIAMALVRPHPQWPSDTSPWAIWVQREKAPNGDEIPTVNFTPADVAPLFASLLDRYPTALLTSATVPEFGSFRLTLGMGATFEGERRAELPDAWNDAVGVLSSGRRADDAGASPFEEEEPISHAFTEPIALAPAPLFEVALPSPYPLYQMATLVVPRGPTPSDLEVWRPWAVERVVEAVHLAQGGALVLATSNQQVRAYAAALKAAPRSWDVRVQNETGRADLQRWFRENIDGVLIGTRSFFQGLDIQGHACRLVIIDRVPIARPGDPVEDAVGKLLVQRAGESSAYMLRTVPQAAMLLEQGVGRLIRSPTDYGAVVLLDRRILFNGPSWTMLLKSLPPFPRTHDMDTIRAWTVRRP